MAFFLTVDVRHPGGREAAHSQLFQIQRELPWRRLRGLIGVVVFAMHSADWTVLIVYLAATVLPGVMINLKYGVAAFLAVVAVVMLLPGRRPAERPRPR